MPQFPTMPRDMRMAELGQGMGGLLGGLGVAAGGFMRQRKEEEKKEKMKDKFESVGFPREWADMPPEIVKLLIQQQLQEQKQGAGAQGLGVMTGLPPEQIQAFLATPKHLQVPLFKAMIEGGLSMGDPAQEGPVPVAQDVQDVAQTAEETRSRKPQQTDLLSNIDDAINLALTETRKEQGLAHPTNIAELVRRGKSKEESQEAFKSASAFDKEINKEAKGAKADDLRLRRMEKLIETGNLRYPAVQNLLDQAGQLKMLGGAAGGLIGSLFGGVGSVPGAIAGATIGGGLAAGAEALIKAGASKETQEFDKLSKEFIRSVKDVMGTARITNLEVETFLKTIPTLAQTDAGKHAVIRNLRIINSGKIVKKEIKDKIIRANNGKRPYNLESLVDQVADPVLDKLAEEFVTGSEALTNQPERQRTDDMSERARSTQLSRASFIP